jgi:putative lipoic acid-binding regulatory protein
MIYERSVVVFTCAVLSTFTSYSNSLATESKVLKSTNFSAKIIVQLNDKQNISDKQHFYTFISNNNQDQEPKKIAKQLEGLNNQSQQGQTKVISQNWSFLGISLTSTLFLVMIWVLFQPDRRNRQRTTITQIDTIDAHKGVNGIEDKVEVLEKEEVIAPEPLPMVVEPEEVIAPEPLPRVVEEEETIIPEPLTIVVEEEETIIPEPLPIVVEPEEVIAPEPLPIVVEPEEVIAPKPLPIVVEEEETIIPEPLPIVVEEEETITPDPLTMIGMEYAEEVIPSFIETPIETSSFIEIPIETPAYIINKDSTNDTTISDPTNKPLQKQIIPFTDKKERLTKSVHSKSIDQPEVMSKVTIVTAKTTEIDVVFELIQDLQQSDRLLRRKAIWKLSYTGDFRAIEPLVAIIPEADSVDKSLILDAITKIAQRSWHPINKALFISLADENAEVKKNAIRDATVLYKSIFPLTQCLSQMLGDSDREVQQTAQWALQQFQQQLSLAPVRNQESEVGTFHGSSVQIHGTSVQKSENRK